MTTHVEQVRADYLGRGDIATGEELSKAECADAVDAAEATPEQARWASHCRCSLCRPASEVTSERSITPLPADVDDAHVAEAFAELIHGRFLYCRALGGWLTWDGTRWKRDQAEAVLERARRFVLDLVAELARTGADSKTIAKASTYRSKTRIEAIVGLARRIHGIAAEADDFDRDHDLLVCTNGVVNLRTGDLLAHDPVRRLTKTTGIAFDPGARHPDVDAVLGVVDADVGEWLQRLFGYSATGHVSEDVMVVLDGTGSNGKTTLLEAVKAALGAYASTAPPRLLMRSGSDEHPTLLADLHGRRLVTIEETAEGGSLRVETMKGLTGGSAIKARFMRADYFEFAPTHQLVVATNHRPAVNSTEHATWRRLRLVPFPHRYAKPAELRPGDRPVDRHLRARLRGAPQRRAMLAWIVQGAQNWYTAGLSEPAAIEAATDDWRRSEDVILRFAGTELVFGSDTSVTLVDLFRAYSRWCESEGRPPGSSKEFAKRFGDHDLIAEHAVERRKTMAGVVWRGVDLASA